MLDLQTFVAPLTAFIIGVLAAWYFKRRISKHRERIHDLKETHKAMVAHYNAMDKIIADDAVPEKIKRSMFAVTNALGNRKLAQRMCEFVIANKHKMTKDTDFEETIAQLRNVRPEIINDIETAMSTALFIVMLRWPETSSKFKQFVVSSMMNEHKETTIFNKVVEIARSTSASKPSHNIGELDGAYA
ncbi:hypothetical protein [uncultured Agrobacterium sp.]|uniref:hypothetical protein n=1 Tax=uncultured Agrobacterium sp. TaxID=157277 RepID=UPI00258D9764|nr:hypothetical protein [uncultured Agrobacterium sp.]